MHKIYAPVQLMLARKLTVAANYAGVEAQIVHHTYDQLKTKEYLAKNPNGKFPVMETPDGKFIWESNAILRYIARLDKSKGLYGNDILEESLVDQWLDWLNGELSLNYFKSIGPSVGWPVAKDEAKAADGKTRQLLKQLDDVLKINTYLVGNKVTIADIAIACVLTAGFRYVFDEKYRKFIANVTRWYENLLTQEPFTKEFGRFYVCQKAIEIVDLPLPAKEEKKKEEPKKQAPAPKKETKEDDGEEAPKEKEKNPLDLLPPTNFNFFDFKTLFVNAADKNEACDFFFKNFDANGFSIWKIDYIKAEGEGKVLFLTNNLMNGFIQRLEHFRKYAFGVHGVYGDEGAYEIAGMWVWRGTTQPAEIKELDSYEFHKFTQMDVSKEEDKALIRQFWTGLNEEESVVDGKVVRTVKYFK